MGVIKKKTVTRGTEGGLKYICDVCAADITATVRIHCADPVCNDYDLCVPCFSEGSSSRDHNPATHPFSVIEQHSIPVYTEDWGTDEELLLLEGAETYGLGSWADIADHIGGYRTREEVRDHYIDTYVNSPNFPLPARADPSDISLNEDVPREVFQMRKKRRIEERKDAAKNAPPAAPKQKPTASVPACHEVQGYMPGRLEFETEFHNEAEEAVMHMQFDPGDGVNPRTGEMDPEMELKMAVMDIYNSKLTARAMRKKAIFEHNLLEYRKNAAVDKKRTKEERELAQKVKPFSRMTNHADFVALNAGIEYEHNLRLAISQLQDWRAHAIGDLKTGEKYEIDKAQRAARPPPTGQFDRMTGARPPKVVPPPETPSATVALVAPDLPERLKPALRPASALLAEKNASSNGDLLLTNGNSTPLTNGTSKGGHAKTPLANGVSNGNARSLYVPPSVPGIAPLKLVPEGGICDLQLLTGEEKELCSVLRFTPKAYLAMKEAILKEAMKSGGALKKKTIREICKIDITKSARLFEFMFRAGWISKA